MRYVGRVIAALGAVGLVGVMACGRGEQFEYRLGKSTADPEDHAKQVDVYLGSGGTIIVDYGRNGTLDIRCTPSRCEALTPFEDLTMPGQIQRDGRPTDLHGRESPEGKKLQAEFDAVRK